MRFIPGLSIFLFFNTVQNYGIAATGFVDLVPKYLGTFTNDLLKNADLAKNHGDYQRATELYSQLVHQHEMGFGPEHPGTIFLCHRLYTVYFETGKFKKALPLAWKIYKAEEKIQGKEHQDTAQALSHLGSAYWGLKQYEKAEQFLKRAYRITKSQLGQNHKDTIEILFILAEVYRQTENLEKMDLALRYYKKVYAVTSKDPENGLGRQHADAIETLRHIGNVLGMQNNFDEASKIFGEVFEIRRATLGEDHPKTQEVRQTLVYTLSHSGRTREATQILRMGQSDNDDDEDDLSLFFLVEAKVATLEKEGKIEKAFEILTQFCVHEILKTEIPAPILPLLDKVMVLSRNHNRGDLEQVIKWVDIVNDLVKSGKVTLTSRNDRDAMIHLSLSTLESSIYISCLRNEEDKIDQHYESVLEIMQENKDNKSTVMAHKFLTISYRVAIFKAQIGKTDQALGLNWNIASKTLNEIESLPAVAAIVEIALKRGDQETLTNVALKFLQIQSNQHQDQDQDQLKPHLKSEAEEVKDLLRESVAQFLTGKGKEHADQENYKNAFSLFKTVWAIWPKKWAKNSRLTGNFLVGIGMNIAFRLNKLDEGLSYVEKAIKLYKETLANGQNEMDEKERQDIAEQIKNLEQGQETYKKLLGILNILDNSQTFQHGDSDSGSKLVDTREKNEL